MKIVPERKNAFKNNTILSSWGRQFIKRSIAGVDVKIGICKVLPAACLCILIIFVNATTWAEQSAPPLFASSGLLVKSDESAEEILLRAHQLDRGAVVLSILGYSQGIGGFPKSPYLASGWISQLAKLNDPETFSLLTLMLWEHAETLDRDYAGMYAMCPSALGSELASLLKRSGVFEAEKFCDNLKDMRNSTPDWEARHAEVAGILKKSQKEHAALIRAIRTFRDTPCSPKSLRDFFEARQKAFPGSVVFYGATTHDPATERPDWSAERLLHFLDAVATCTQAQKTGDLPGNDNQGDAHAALMKKGIAAMENLLTINRDMILPTIREAHSLSGENAIQAMRSMSMHYREGSSGFMQSDMLSILWLQQAAFAFDPESSLLLALHRFSEKKYTQAWAWADIIRNDKDTVAEIRELANQLLAMIERRAENDVRVRGKQFASAYIKAMMDMVDWADNTSQGRNGIQ